MQNIEQKLVLRGAIGENASEGEPTLVIGMKARLLVRSVNESGTASAPANISDVASWKFILAEDWNPATNPCYIADAEWNPATATWTILLDGTRTAEMLSALGTEGVIDIGCEIAGLPENGTWDKPLFVAQWTMPMRNRRDSDGAPTPLDPSPVTPHAAQHAVGGVDPVTPASIGAASVADATLTAVFGEWGIVAAEPTTIEWGEFEGITGWIPKNNGQTVGVPKGDASSTSLSWNASANPPEAGYDITATRASTGYQLGSQTNKPLQPAGNYALKSEIPPAPQLRYALVSPALATSGTTVSATLQDRAVNAITLASTVTAATFTFPAPVAGYARDFFLRLVIEGSTVPTISFLESGGGSLEDVFDADDDAWAEIEPGVNVLMFTETSQEAAP